MILSDHFSLRLFLPKLTVHRTKLGVKFQPLILEYLLYHGLGRCKSYTTRMPANVSKIGLTSSIMKVSIESKIHLVQKYPKPAQAPIFPVHVVILGKSSSCRCSKYILIVTESPSLSRYYYLFNHYIKKVKAPNSF